MHSDVWYISGCFLQNPKTFCCVVQHPCQIFFDISNHFSELFFLSSLSAFPMIYTSSFERPIAFSLLQELFLYFLSTLFTLAKQSLLTTVWKLENFPLTEFYVKSTLVIRKCETLYFDTIRAFKSPKVQFLSLYYLAE